MNHSLPEEISTALYYASLASALVHCKTHISSVDSQSFQNGLAWLSERPWINRDMQKLYLDALAALANRPIP
jgi:hypothetical protein